MRNSVKAERSTKKSGPHRVVIEKAQNGVSVTAHHSAPGSFSPNEQPPATSVFTKAGPAKKHIAEHLSAMMPNDHDGDEPGEQGGGAPVAV